MPRGNNYWEMTFDPDGTDPTVEMKLTDLDNLSGFMMSKVRIEPPPNEKRLNLKGKRFVTCDFKGGLQKASFTNCEFEDCKFQGVHLTSVKFSKCSFTKCHFLHIDLDSCTLLNCTYKNISVSAEHIKFDSTEIDVTQFLKGVTTNLNYLPETTTADFQRSQLIQSKAKLAGILYRSNQELFGPHFFIAHKHLTLLTFRSNIEDKRFLPPTKGRVALKRNRIYFYYLTLGSRIDLWAVKISGALTNWGRSIARAITFLLLVILCFSIIYHTCFGLHWNRSFLRSIEVSLVAGYTAHTNACDTRFIRLTTLVNLLLGIYWYSLIVPVVTRKFLR